MHFLEVHRKEQLAPVTADIHKKGFVAVNVTPQAGFNQKNIVPTLMQFTHTVWQNQTKLSLF